MDTGVTEAMRLLRLPGILRRLYAWYWRYIRKDAAYASIIEVWREKTTVEFFSLVSRREAYREQWFNMWTAQELDFVLTVPNSLPAPPHDGMKDGWSACGYTFLFNIVRTFPPPQYTDTDERTTLCSLTTPQVFCP